MKNWLNDKTILITGGTSGLGKSLVYEFLANGCQIISIARNGQLAEINNDNYKHFSSDFSNLSTIEKTIDKFVKEKISIDVLINNAGVLSPPRYEESKDGFELSYQVNFLSHVYLTRLLLKHNLLNPKLIVNISSPIHTKGHLDLDKALDQKAYGLFQAYSNSKLYMALFSQRLSEEGFPSFSFNPGTFNSGIYQLQDKWFHTMYKLAAPFMAPSKKVAKGLSNVVLSQTWENGKMMNKYGKQRKMLKCNESDISKFWLQVDQQLAEITNENR